MNSPIWKMLMSFCRSRKISSRSVLEQFQSNFRAISKQLAITIRSSALWEQLQLNCSVIAQHWSRITEENDNKICNVKTTWLIIERMANENATLSRSTASDRSHRRRSKLFIPIFDGEIIKMQMCRMRITATNPKYFNLIENLKNELCWRNSPLHIHTNEFWKY